MYTFVTIANSQRMPTKKNSGKATNILKCYFSKQIYNLAHQTKYLHIENFSSHKQYLFNLVLPTNVKKTHTDKSILQTFLLCLKTNVSLTFKSNSCKKVFPKCVYHWYNLLRLMFFIPCDNWKMMLFFI